MKGPIIDDCKFLGFEGQWGELARRIRAAGRCGLDTEFYNVNVKKQSCVGRAVVHVWSIALPGERRTPLGFHRSSGWVLPAAAFLHPALRAVLEDPSIVKAVHNQPVDDHALHNHGVKLRGCINTLGLARWVWPELINQGGFGLKNLMRVKLRRNPICEFPDVVGDVRTVTREVTRMVERTLCHCGVEGCRLRKGHDKYRAKVPVVQRYTKEEKFQHPLESIVEGHPRWDLLVKYAAEDAVAALELLELMEAERNPGKWVYTDGERPAFAQPVEDAITRMERVGFHRDRPFCTLAAIRAGDDEQRELAWLHRWYVLNAPWFGPHRREETDITWSSAPRLLALLDGLKFPRSPVWKKGQVKRGEVKLDSVALQWIAKNHPPAVQLVEHLLHLKRIRAGKKYLEKLRDADEIIHPICGPAGDADDRNGAVTGRLGVKGEVEAQQLPIKKELDLYQVRRAIVAGPGETLLVADYSALEVVILADLCLRLFGDDQLAEVTAPGAPDIHCENARMVFGKYLGWKVPDADQVVGEDGKALPYAGLTVDSIPTAEFKTHPYGAVLRDMIKTVWYGLQYGKGAYGFSVLPGPDGKPIGEAVAQAMLDGIEKAIPGPFRWQRWVEKYVKVHHGIYSLGGRWCPLYDETDEWAPDWLRNRGYRRAYNFPIQATGAELIGDATVRLLNDPEWAATGFRVCLQVHDELVARGPVENTERAGAILRRHMTEATANGTQLLVPLQVKVGSGSNYYEAK